jgi:SPP1 family phage portal protein
MAELVKTSYTGRSKIYCDEKEITAENVGAVLSSALQFHNTNSVKINYLYNYRRGTQPILDRTKEVRPDICNKIVENRADEIVSFKTGYLCGEPLQYVSRGGTDTISAGIQKLNDAMILVGKASQDKKLAEWMYTCGTGYRIVLSEKEYARRVSKGIGTDPDEAPFRAFVLDPRYAFVIYYSGLGEPPIAGVKYITREDKSVIYSIWTETEYFELTEANKETSISFQENHPYRMVPIVEYPLNSIRLGAFEVVLGLLDAINTVHSNRIDGIEQFIQSLIVLYNAEIDETTAANLRAAGLIQLKSTETLKSDIKILSETLKQMDTQVLADYMYQTVLDIVGMPNRNGGKSTSDTGLAVQLRDGWSSAEARAKSDEIEFKDAELKFLKLVLRIMRDTVNTPLLLSDIETKFTRRIYEGLVAKSQVYANLIKSGVPPDLACVVSCLFSDPADAAKQIKEYAKQKKAEDAAALEAQAKLAQAKTPAGATPKGADGNA